MMKRNMMILLALAALVLASLACDFNVSTAAVSSVILTADKAGTTDTATFTSDQAFYLVVTTANAPDSTKFRAVWYSLDDAGKATQFLEKEIVTGSSPITFSATANQAWPAGKYRVELYMNDKLNTTKEFSVQ